MKKTKTFRWMVDDGGIYSGPWCDGICFCFMGCCVLSGRGPHVHIGRRGKMEKVQIPQPGSTVTVLRRSGGRTICKVTR